MSRSSSTTDSFIFLKFFGTLLENFGLNSEFSMLVVSSNNLEGILPWNLCVKKTLQILVLLNNRFWNLTNYNSLKRSILGTCKFGSLSFNFFLNIFQFLLLKNTI